MADELKIKIVLDTGEVKEGFLSVENQAAKASKSIGKSFDNKGEGLNSLTDGLNAAAGGVQSLTAYAANALGPIGGLTIAIAGASAATFKLALAGEQVNAVNAQFANVAKSAGLSAESFGNAIIEATQGLIDDEDALQIATKGIVALGNEASKLPAILDAARGVSRTLGKDFKATFEDLSTFVESGNKKVLKNFGIVLDLDKAYERAARSIGLTAAQLNEQQRQQVRVNLLLDEVPKKFSAAANSVTPLKDSFDRLKVSSGNAFDSIAISFNKALGPAIQSAIGLLDRFIKKQVEVSGFTSNDSLTANLAKYNTTVLEATLKIPILTKNISDLNEKLATSKSVGEKVQINSQIQKLQGQVDRLSESSDFAKEKIKGLGGISINAPDVPEQIAAPKNTALVVDSEQQKLISAEKIKKEQDFSAFLLSEQTKRINTEIQLKQLALAGDLPIDQQKLLNAQILEQQLLLQKAQQQAAVDAANKQFAGKEVTDLQNQKEALKQIEITSENDLLLIKKKSEQDKLNIQKKFDAAGLSATSSALGTIATLQESSSEELAVIGKAAAITKATIDGYTAVQSALANVPYPFNFPAAALVGVAAAANVAKIAGVGGGGGAKPSFDAGGGGIAASPSTSTELTQPENLQRAEASTAVSVVIQGDVLDSDESGSRIVSLINSAFDKKGVVINQGVFA